jgi:hypothetical protein
MGGDIGDRQILQVIARLWFHDQGAALLELALGGEQGGAEGNGFVRAHGRVRRPAEDVAHSFPYSRNPRGSADGKHEVHVLRRHPGSRHDVEDLLRYLVEQRSAPGQECVPPNLDAQQQARGL